MALLKSRPRRYLLITLLSFLIILLICIFLVIRFYIPSQIKELLLDFSEKNNIALSVKNITYNPFVGFRGEDITIDELPEKGITRIEASNITVRPGLIRSFVKGKLIIEEIEVNNAHIELTDQISKLAGSKDEEETGDIKEERKLEIQRIRMNDISLSYLNKYRLNLNSLYIEAGDNGNGFTEVDLKGQLDGDTAFFGNLKINNSKNEGELYAELNNIGKGIYAKTVSVPQEISVTLRSDFNYDKVINIKGKMVISGVPHDDIKPEIASIDFDTVYDNSSATLGISGLNLESDIIFVSAEGEISDIGSDPAISLNGKFNIEKLSESKKWILPLKETEITGSVHSDNLTIEGFPAKNKYSLTAVIFSDSLSVKKLELTNTEVNSFVRMNNNKKVIQIKEINSELFGGSISGELSYTPTADSYDLKADIKGKNIDAGQIGHRLDLPLGGIVDRFALMINAAMDNIRSDITLESDNMSYGEGEDSLNITKAFISSPLEVEITNLRDENRQITVTGTNVGITGFSYAGIHSGSSIIPEIGFKYNNNIWELDISAKGKELKRPSNEIKISDYDLHLHVENREFTSARGKLGGTAGSFGDFSFTKPATSFDYDHEKIKLIKIELQSEEYGKLSNATAEIKLPENNEDEYEIDITKGSVSVFDSEVAVKDLEGKLSYKNDGTPIIKGTLSSNIIHAFGIEFIKPDINFSYGQNKFNISGFKAGLYKGVLSGSGYYKTEGSGSDFHLDVGLKKSKHIAGLDFIDLESLSLSLTGKFGENKRTSGHGKLSFSDLSINKNGKVSNLNGSTDIKLHNDSILFENGVITSASDHKLRVKGEIRSLFSEDRGSNFEIADISLSSLAYMISPLLPEDISSGIFNGSISASLNTYNLFEKLSNWKGKLEIKNAGFMGSLSKTDFQIKGMNGTVTLKDSTVYKNKLEELMGKELVITKDVYMEYVDQFIDYEIKNNKDYLDIEQLKYGFLTLNDIKTVFEIDKEKINLLHWKSKVYNGNIYGIGVLRFGGQKENYNLSLLVDDISLRQITDSLPSMQNYITGTVYGLLWFSVGDSYWTINGPFSFWAKDSKEEKRTIGRALLEKLGAKSRFFTRSSRRYDKGVISGYIKDGIMTFKNFEISNRILGYRDLIIRADKKMNSISVKHLLSVIRELARRASKGEIKIDYEKEKK